MSPWAFACSSDNYTDPPGPPREPLPVTHFCRKLTMLTSTGERHGTYVVCLECGREFRYDWTQMTIGEAVAVPTVCQRVQDIRGTPRADYQEARDFSKSLQA
jgi:hypothetical protein